MFRQARLLIVSTHKLFRECLATMLAEIDGFQVHEQSLVLEEVLARAVNLQPQVVLVDLTPAAESPAGRVFELIQQIANRSPEIKVLVMGVSEADPDILKCIEMGASGYVSKESSVTELNSAINVVLAGGAVCPSRLAYSTFSLLAELASDHQRSLRVEALQLTPREIEILQLIAEGMSNKKIADRLSLSIFTVKNHVHHILDKLQVERRAAAVDHAFERHWFRESAAR